MERDTRKEQDFIKLLLDSQMQQQAAMDQSGKDRFNRLNESGALGGIRESPRNRGGSLNEGLGYLRTPEERIQRILDSHAGNRAEQMVMSDPSFAQDRANQWLGVQPQEQGANESVTTNPFSSSNTLVQPELFNPSAELDPVFITPDSSAKIPESNLADFSQANPSAEPTIFTPPKKPMRPEVTWNPNVVWPPREQAPQTSPMANNSVKPNEAEVFKPIPMPQGSIENHMSRMNNFFSPILDHQMQKLIGGNGRPFQNASDNLQSIVSALLDNIRN